MNFQTNCLFFCGELDKGRTVGVLLPFVGKRAAHRFCVVLRPLFEGCWRCGILRPAFCDKASRDKVDAKRLDSESVEGVGVFHESNRMD